MTMQLRGKSERMRMMMRIGERGRQREGEGGRKGEREGEREGVCV